MRLNSQTRQKVNLRSPLGKFSTDQKLVSVNISANLKEMTIPEIISGKDGQLSLSGNVLKVIPGDAEIIINGLTVGMCSKDQKIKVPEGICRMQIKRTGFVMKENSSTHMKDCLSLLSRTNGRRIQSMEGTNQISSGN